MPKIGRQKALLALGGCVLVLLLFVLIAKLLAPTPSNLASSGTGGNDRVPPAAPPPTTPDPTQTPLQAKVEGKVITHGVVGRKSSLVFTVTNSGRDIADLGVKLNLGSDNWLDHHVVTGGDCQRDQAPIATGWLRCGLVKAGEIRTITVVAAFKDAGNFSYSASFGDRWHDLVQEVKNENGSTFVLGWQEAIIP